MISKPHVADPLEHVYRSKGGGWDPVVLLSEVRTVHRV